MICLSPCQKCRKHSQMTSNFSLEFVDIRPTESAVINALNTIFIAKSKFLYTYRYVGVHNFLINISKMSLNKI